MRDIICSNADKKAPYLTDHKKRKKKQNCNQNLFFSSVFFLLSLMRY